ncbi:HigA family addiction module antitoxin [Thiomicrorhabdus sp.]|uniref:HigA family addiction module antitoxin n=1 Tax=Thiomicrorhabdus sp. TaxID=2039724 RepID=UPI0029C7F969|nr:HigA family addiction module antitoxin [Thiomicrorhabdus sp.]
MTKIDNIHPGDILLEEFLEPLAISQTKLAKVMKVSPRRINEIVHRKRAISADTAIRLGLALGTTAQFWTNLQAAYDLEEASLAKALEFKAIERIVA